ncbi:MAG: M28 family peptidase [bacterium]
MDFRSAAIALLMTSVTVACSSSDPVENNNNTAPYDDPTAVSERLQATLWDLAAFGEKRAGTPAGAQAADYLFDRFETAGLQNVRFESFSFLLFELESSAMTVTADGVPLAIEHDVFAYSGSGSADATVVFVGHGKPADYVGKDVAGRVVLVERDEIFHRSAQYSLIVEHGGAAMLYVSASPDNLIQIGTVGDPEDGLGPIPAVTVGTDDGQRIIDALDAGQTVRATTSVTASVGPATGRNVVGELPGTDPSGGYFLVGGHYDTWFTGSVDNSTGVAATLEIAESLVLRGPRIYGISFVAYDGEELGLLGGYDFLRKHVVVDGEPLLAFLNFEMPANAGDGLRALGYTNGAGFYDAILESELEGLYIFVAGLELVAGLFGGSIPTDIQGLYWYGLQGVTTACQSPWYHTTEDTPDKVDYEFFADAVLRFQDLLDVMDLTPIEDFQRHDPEVWRLQVTTSPAGADLTVDVTVQDADGAPQAGALVRLWLDVDDFTRSFDATGLADSSGELTFTVPAASLSAGTGAGDNWLHVTGGEEYPLVEAIHPLP